jgi:hypothetical protein
MSNTRRFAILLISLLTATLKAETLELYVDAATKQVYAEPGENRIRLGSFQRVDESRQQTDPDTAPRMAAGRAAEDGAAAAVAAGSSPPDAAERPRPSSLPSAERAARSPSAPVPAQPRAWYDRYSIRGYVQLRHNELLDDDLDGLQHFADRSVGDDQSLLIRRARLILSGDVSDRVSLYLQPDFGVTPSGSSTTHFVQLRDAYADVFFDANKEFRVRVGQSKVPYGFENLQSSQNRLALDRNDALNSCCKDERDIGAFFYWSPEPIRTRFRELVASGLKGSGDYGVVAFGLYNGQGANRFERNDGYHVVGRFSYPMLLDNGQLFEAGIQGYRGRFVPTADPGIALETAGRGFEDRRIGVHAILYPQPLGLQAEWNWGRGPELNQAMTAIETSDLDGGYVQASYKLDTNRGTLIPFVRWQRYDGAMKFERNAPSTDTTETEFGLEWQPRPELELVGMYVKTDRTNVLQAPYEQYEGDMLRLQLQWNY